MKKQEEWKPTKTAMAVFEALKSLGGEAFNGEIADKLGIYTNGVSVSLGRLRYYGYIEMVRQNRNNPRWRILKKLP